MATRLSRLSACDFARPVITPSDLAAVLAAQNVTDILLAEVTAPPVTISIEEKVLAPAALCFEFVP